MKALPLLKHNIDTLLDARNQTRHDLAVWVRQSTNRKRVDPWISKIFTTADAEFQTKYLDRIADFFGIAVYQLFQPGISPLTERRSRSNRRTGRDRRISQAVLSERPGDVDVMHIIRALSREKREKAIGLLVDLLNDEIRRPPAKSASTAGKGRSGETAATVQPPARTRGRSR